MNEKNTVHVKTIAAGNLKATASSGGCRECQTSCQSACKTSCTREPGVKSKRELSLGRASFPCRHQRNRRRFGDVGARCWTSGLAACTR